MPADIQLSGMEVSLVNAMSRETILRQYPDTLKGQYSHILIDCQPSLGMLTVNALAAANRIIILLGSGRDLACQRTEQLLSTVKVKRQINPKLQIDGILPTVDNRTNFAKEIAALLRDNGGSKSKSGTEIPLTDREADCECPLLQKSTGKIMVLLPDHYEDLGNGVYQVYVEIDGKVVPYVAGILQPVIIMVKIK